MSKVQRIRVKYEKKAEIKFLSHRDVINIFERAVRRSELPIAYSEGYNPHMKISYGPPLKLGLHSDNQFADFFMAIRTPLQDFFKRLQDNLPPVIKLLEVQEIDLNHLSLFEELKNN